MTIESKIKVMAQAARAAAKQLSRVSTGQKNAALSAIADYLAKEADFIRAENRKDLSRAEEKVFLQP